MRCFQKVPWKRGNGKPGFHFCLVYRRPRSRGRGQLCIMMMGVVMVVVVVAVVVAVGEESSVVRALPLPSPSPSAPRPSLGSPRTKGRESLCLLHEGTGRSLTACGRFCVSRCARVITGAPLGPRPGAEGTEGDVRAWPLAPGTSVSKRERTASPRTLAIATCRTYHPGQCSLYADEQA